MIDELNTLVKSWYHKAQQLQDDAQALADKTPTKRASIESYAMFESGHAYFSCSFQLSALIKKLTNV